MFNFKPLLTITLLVVSSVASAAEQAPDVQQVVQLIEKADSYRLQDDSSKVVSLVRLYQDQELDKTRLYHVYTRPNRESLVVFKSAVEAGQKMLMMGDNYWLQMPKSRRPIRITPMQKLLGEASIGDISTLTWSQDYQGEWKATETLTINGQSIAVYRLALTAKTKGASYQKIDLWLSEQDAFPIKADLYLRSGKLAKQAQYGRATNRGEDYVSEMTLLDSIQPSKKTVIEYQEIVPWQLDNKFYNPSYLPKANTSEL
ncbi:outer membrane lipoprotein-sorting protein [Vibrio parahaemolyticus]|uniref:outer membrane lipoprotein-sorting protein n=1 Tax=Vibrio parahaemolyticus TaxID=670 RepID=UPI0003FE0B5F|nr:outer membrane lipoprotein-sorting protein [Vibrio parahaemolyticus]EGU6976896.1 outer membrane lipoprotein-sorting protein [Vibrio parahaemolyticus]EIO2935189.1 outer membrane lipoprotein-sorting protein [Vibrio parahaemolyticus]EIO2938316.1 outer membrane lipoprotein-sorting protein [Vibrio parahaemolyticus]EKB1989911.1 outer membrane lipoprotein-sorting protein [Vibrio parahaemolyticus]EKB1992728.1 outer membrane lipoprotein-sorting protein [Vibrio parahaemolyticus]